MARKWCGFLPQNQTIKKNWQLLEARQEEPPPRREAAVFEEATEPSQEPDEESSPPGEPVPIRVPKPE